MYRFEKLLVNLSLTGSDIPTLRFASLISKLACSESIHFIYSREPVEIPTSVQSQYPWLMEPIHSSALAKAKDLVSEHFDGYKNCKTTIEVQERTPLISILEHSLKSSTDLIITGDSQENRTLAVKLARKAPCSLLVVPPKSSGSFSKVCAGIDVSRYSKYVVDVAVTFTKANGLKQTDFLHYYQLPAGHHKTNIPKENLLEDLHSFSEEKIRKFLAEQNLKGVLPVPILKESYCPGTAIAILADHEDYDLTVIGCRGKDALTAALLGSNAEDSIQSVTRCAILAVKEKGTGISFLETLLGSKSSGNLF